MADRVYLHVGTPKSGTTYLQAILWQNVARLEAAGLLLPARFNAHYAAAKGITDRGGRKRRDSVDADTAWPALADQINAWSGSAVISHELLAPATPTQAGRAKSLLDGADVHVVVTARALHRQLPASWQEQVKGGLATPYPEFVQSVRDRQARGEWFWDVQDLAAIAARWGDGLAAENIHIVTVPPQSADPTALWSRFAATLGLEPAAYDVDVPRKNVSLGPIESELLRRVHAVHDRRFTDPHRHQWTRRLLATEILGRRSGPGLRLPDEAESWVKAAAAQTIASLSAAGYDVVGDLADLEWRGPDADARSTDSVTAAEVDRLSERTIGRLQEELMQREPATPPPSVGPTEGAAGILELLEHIRAADTSATPRAAARRQLSTPSLFRRSIDSMRRR